MNDNIFYGNLIGLLKSGRWSLNLQEASALVALFEECQNRIAQPLVNEKKEPIKSENKKVKDADKQ